MFLSVFAFDLLYDTLQLMLDGCDAEKLYSRLWVYNTYMCLRELLWLLFSCDSLRTGCSLFCLAIWAFFIMDSDGSVLFCFLFVLMATKKCGFSGTVRHFIMYYFCSHAQLDSTRHGYFFFLVLIGGSLVIYFESSPFSSSLG